MPFEIESIVEPRMIVMRAYGVGSSSEGHRAFQAVQAHAAYVQGLPILMDRVDLEYLPTASEGRVLAGLFATAFPCSVMALLSTPGAAHAAAQEVARLAVGRGASVGAFTCREEAIAWLTDTEPSVPDLATDVEPVPPVVRLTPQMDRDSLHAAGEDRDDAARGRGARLSAVARFGGRTAGDRSRGRGGYGQHRVRRMRAACHGGRSCQQSRR
jgi:hypothetical protein